MKPSEKVYELFKPEQVIIEDTCTVIIFTCNPDMKTVEINTHDSPYLAPLSHKQIHISISSPEGISKGFQVISVDTELGPVVQSNLPRFVKFYITHKINCGNIFC